MLSTIIKISNNLLNLYVRQFLNIILKPILSIIFFPSCFYHILLRVPKIKPNTYFLLWGPTKETKQLDIKQTRLRASVLLSKLLDIKLERFVRFLSSSHVILYYCFC